MQNALLKQIKNLILIAQILNIKIIRHLKKQIIILKITSNIISLNNEYCVFLKTAKKQETKYQAIKPKVIAIP